MTGDTAIRLADAFGTSAEFWMRLQGDYDLARAREARVAGLMLDAEQGERLIAAHAAATPATSSR